MKSPIKIYEYKNCSTCRNALKYLESKGIEYKKIPIRDTPPSKAELKKMFIYMGKELKKLFNTSGGDYKELKLKDKLPKMSTEEAFDMLSKNGNLVKRPFVITDDNGIVGFKEDQWKAMGIK